MHCGDILWLMKVKRKLAGEESYQRSVNIPLSNGETATLSVTLRIYTHTHLEIPLS